MSRIFKSIAVIAAAVALTACGRAIPSGDVLKDVVSISPACDGFASIGGKDIYFDGRQVMSIVPNYRRAFPVPVEIRFRAGDAVAQVKVYMEDRDIRELEATEYQCRKGKQ